MEPLMDGLHEELLYWSRLRHEQDGRALLTEREMEKLSSREAERRLHELMASERADGREPSDWLSIEALCDFPELKCRPDRYSDRVRGALIGRFAGCVLGVPVENYSVERMQAIAENSGTPFPPTEYWHAAEDPDGIQYGIDRRRQYTLGGINGVPVDDDITYTVLNLLLLKQYGEHYTTQDAGELWKELVPYACTAEERALARLKEGVSALRAAEGNPFVEWIGAAIRADAFGYVAAGDPVRAARMCYADAYLTHRRNGIYGEMFAAASVAAAFVLPPDEAIAVGARCVPRQSSLARDLNWALSFKGRLKDFMQARALLDARFSGMHCVHVRNNLCAVVFAVLLGEGDFTRTVSQSVAMGMDNDCNAATAGSIVGAHVGLGGVPSHWYLPFGDTVRTYLTGLHTFSLEGLAQDFEQLYQKFIGGKR